MYVFLEGTSLSITPILKGIMSVVGKSHYHFLHFLIDIKVKHLFCHEENE
jgi:hypothetical protein